MQMVIKAADLSHVARELPYHVEWVQRITLEQNSQVDAEKSLGLPFMPFMDRDQGFPSFLKSQKGCVSGGDVLVNEPQIHVPGGKAHPGTAYAVHAHLGLFRNA